MGEPRPPGGGDAAEAKTFSSGDKNRPSYSDMAKRKFPNVTIDLVAGEAGESKRLSYSVVADIIFDFLKLKRSEFVRFQTFKEEDDRFTLKIRTTTDIDVKRRYGTQHEFEALDTKEGITWKASIRGGGEEKPRKEKEKTLKLRVINPPEEASFTELKQEIEKFGEMRSRIVEEVVSIEEEPRLAGYPTGVLHLWIKDIPKVPSFITVRRQKVRVHVALPPNVCLKCRGTGHRAAECKEGSDNQEGNSANENDVGKTNGMDDEMQELEDDIAVGIESGRPENVNEDGLVFAVSERNKKSKKSVPTIVKPVRGEGGASRGRGKREGLRSTS